MSTLTVNKITLVMMLASAQERDTWKTTHLCTSSYLHQLHSFMLQ